jgi:hypothetical protein
MAMPLMDAIGIAPIQRGDQSRGVQILGLGAVGGQGGSAPSLAPSKGKGKVVRVIRSDDEVSSNDDDDVPLQRRMRARGRGRSTAVGPPPTAPTSRPASLVVARSTVPGGSSGSSAAGDMVETTRVASAKEVVDATVAKEVVEEVMGKKKATEEAAVKKKASEEAAKKTESGRPWTTSGLNVSSQVLRCVNIASRAMRLLSRPSRGTSTTLMRRSWLVSWLLMPGRVSWRSGQRKW